MKWWWSNRESKIAAESVSKLHKQQAAMASRSRSRIMRRRRMQHHGRGKQTKQHPQIWGEKIERGKRKDHKLIISKQKGGLIV